MSLHVYPITAAVSDLARIGTGLVLAAVPILAFDPAPMVTWLLAGMVALFAASGVVAVLRHLSRIEADAGGIRRRGPVATDLAWRNVRRVELAYYSTRRDRSGGWLQLSVFDGRRRISVDSRIAGFADLAADAAAAAAANRLRLEAATAANFHALGIALGARRVDREAGR
ncbi:MAG: hypothetical protein ACFCUO_06955 [Rhodospirillales bacterium]